MKLNNMLSKKHIATLLLASTAGMVFAGGQVEAVNADFARDVYASRASILFIGDSTNNPRGASSFVPYYEAFLQTLPQAIDLCGFRMSGSMGNESVNRYVHIASGATSQMEDSRIFVRREDTLVGNTGHSPPGYRNEFTVIQGGSLPSPGRFDAIGIVNLEGVYPHAAQWAQDATVVIRTPFFITDDQSTLDSISMALLTDHGGLPGGSVSQFDVQPAVDIVFENDRFGIQYVDAVFENPQTTRVGVQFSGDSDSDDANESGKILAWSDHVLFDRNRQENNRGVYFDSISIGGYSAGSFIDSLDPVLLREYVAVAPRPYSTVLVWLGQNQEIDEYNGQLQPIWGERIEAIGDMALQAIIDAGSSDVPMLILVNPPLADGDYPSNRLGAMKDVLDEIATRRGWGHIDMYSLLGASLTSIDPVFDAPGPHASQEGAIYLTSLLYEHLDCLRAEFTGDNTRNFFDVSAFLTLFAAQDPNADFNGDGVHNFFDISAFLTVFSADCS